jgi:FkbM family methyltransferase
LAGTGPLPWPLRHFSNAVFWLHDRCAYSARIQFGGRELVFLCRSRRALRRAATLFVKEQGTVDWLKSTAREGDVLLDIGANVGTYSILAAVLVGASGRVIAVEPHIANAATLLENVAANGFSDRMSVLSMALGPKVGFEAFNYRDWEIGSAFSQLGQQVGEGGRAFQPVAREWKPTATVDWLIEQGAIESPSLVKLDVDGLEPSILQGMARLLSGPNRPRSMQVEISPETRVEIESIMERSGYRLVSRHHTLAGKKRMGQGVEELELDHNAIFATV